jgi:hypothetical protein
MKQYPIKLSVTMSVTISLVVLSARMGMGGGRDIINMVVSEMFVFVVSLACCLAIFYVLRSSPTNRWWLDPLIAAFCCGCLSIFICICSHMLFEDLVDRQVYEKSIPEVLWILFFRGIMITSIVYPVASIFERLRKEQEEKLALERLRLENLLARLNYLQQQMNPDLFFNSLRVLTSKSNDDWTRDYAAHLAGIYRYLVSLNHESYLVTLEDEVRFTEAYIHILRERFEDSLDISIRLSVPGNERYIPPLALQTVVENAIKHNALSPSSPLRIRIYNEAELLVVENDLLPSAFAASPGSPGIGLNNLRERYRIIGGLSPLIIRGAGVFIVKLPLLPDQAGLPAKNSEQPAVSPFKMAG